jgi:hypothetical protein
LREARDVPYDSELSTRVPSPEHLVAIMVLTGRAKDRARAAMFLSQGVIDVARLRELLTRYGLIERYIQWTA